MRANYSADKRRRELAAQQKREAKAAKFAQRKALKAQYPDGIPPEVMAALEGGEEESETPST